MFKSVSPQVDFPTLEKELLEKWKKTSLVEKYLHRNDSSEKHFAFLDGPITANNPMGVHHAWGRTYKDLWQRFWNLRGYKQRFQNGFDCQGLWVEVEVEKELGVRNKKDIENLVPGDKKASIAKFVELCRERVKKFSAIQTEQSKRLGYFMDWDNSYFTMSDENNYMIWYFLKTCHEKGWIYKGKDSVPWCPRCETAISQHEMLTEDYKEVTHETVFVKLPITSNGWENTSLLIWTTTPWTVPANVVVGVNKRFMYGVWESLESTEKIIFIEKDEMGNVPTRLLKDKELKVSDYILKDVNGDWKKIKEVSGKDLIGLFYKTPYDDLTIVQNAKKECPEKFHSVVDGSDIVVAGEGTGLLHVATGAGKEDFDLGKKEGLPVISPIKDDASYVEQMDELAGKNAKKHPELIIDYLKNYESGNYLLKTLNYTHRYPACWRCKTELVWRTAEEWYIAMDKPGSSKLGQTLREQMIETAKKIDWRPSFGLERELDWLSNMHDWLISKKNRYWGLALPIYECQKCGKFQVVGSREELQEKSLSGWDNFEGHSPHKPYIDEVTIKCDCGMEIKRIDDVGNVWLDAGIVPFSTYIDPKSKKLSYTIEKKYWKEWFPADFITESFPGQFKNWFYSLIAMSTVLEKTNSFKTVLGFASMLGEDGRPMHKSWGNSIEFNEGADKIGVDVMRWMFTTHDPEQNILFGYKKADETRRRFHLMLWNIYNFFITYANIANWEKGEYKKSDHALDRWILSRLVHTIEQTTAGLEQYDSQKASLSIESFVNDLSLWYVRRSRDRVDPTSTDGKDKNACFQTLHYVLVVLSKLLAPFTPFIAEEIYTNLTGEESVHLANWPEQSSEFKVPVSSAGRQNSKLIQDMVFSRQIAEAGHAARKKTGIRVRQPMSHFVVVVKDLSQKLSKEIESLVLDELNIKKLIWEVDSKLSVSVTVLEPKAEEVITEELKAEGQARDIVRQIQEERKKLGTRLDEEINVVLPDFPKEFKDYIRKKALIKNLTIGEFSVSKL